MRERTITKNAMAELVMGGQRSGKSRWAEERAMAWLVQSPQHKAVMIASAHAGDEEMRDRIARHQADRAARLPGMLTVEVPLQVAQAIAAHHQKDTLLVVDCLTLWLTNQMMAHADLDACTDTLVNALEQATGPVVLISNEIGLGVVPMGREVRTFVDALGRLNQQVARVCGRVTLMAAGLPLTLKE